MTRTLTILATMVTAAMAGPIAVEAKRPSTCPPTTAFTPVLRHLDGYRVFTGPDGDSAVAPFRLDARDVPMLKTGKTLGILDLPAAPKRASQIVVGAPDIDLPLHPAPYKEMFIMLGGSVTFKTAKFTAEMKPGSVLLFEDVDAKVGHGGRTGPCGYVSLSVAP